MVADSPRRGWDAFRTQLVAPEPDARAMLEQIWRLPRASSPVQAFQDVSRAVRGVGGGASR